MLPETGTEPNAYDAFKTETLSDALLADWRQRSEDDSSWAIVILDCCASDVGVTNLIHKLTASAYGRPRRLQLFPVTAQGASHSGRFVDALESNLNPPRFTVNDQRVPLQELFRRISSELGIEPDGSLPSNAELINPLSRPSPVTMTLDAYQEIERALTGWSREGRTHFMAKAQGSEVGEPAWHFCGRTQELKVLSEWLNNSATGIRVVTGDAGSGKSAILGHLAVLADHNLVEAMRSAKLYDQALPFPIPPDGVFDAMIHLTGKTLVDCLQDLKRIPVLEESLKTAPNKVESVLHGLRDAGQKLTILTDALDESQEPLTIADFFRRAAAIPQIRILVGTRRSLSEGLDQPVPRHQHELIDALGADDQSLIEVGLDPTASGEYVRRRLSVSRSPYSHRKGSIDAIVRRIEEARQPFLFARLATAELLARPAVAPGDQLLDELLNGGHRRLFSAAVERISEVQPSARALLHALALSRGRGLPETGGIWVTVARTIGAGIAVPDIAVKKLIEHAAPYLTLDGEGGQSTYRLAHQTFVESFRSSAGALDSEHRAVARALLRQVAAGEGWSAANYYAVRYIPEHLVADSGRLPEDIDRLATLISDPHWLRRALTLLGIDRLPDLLTELNRTLSLPAIDTVSRALRRSRVALGRNTDELAAQLTARLHLVGDQVVQRLVSRLPEVAPTYWLRARGIGMGWRADLDAMFTVDRTVRALAFGRIRGEPVLAIGVGSEIRLWDPRHGIEGKRTISNYGQRVTALCLAEVDERPIVLIGAGYDGLLSMRDLLTSELIRPEFQLGSFCDSVAVGLVGRRRIVTAVGNGTAWTWDAATGEPLLNMIDAAMAAGHVWCPISYRDRLFFVVSPRTHTGPLKSYIFDPETKRALLSPKLHPVKPLTFASSDVAGRLVLGAATHAGVDVWYPEEPDRASSRSIDFSFQVRALALGEVDGRLVVAGAHDHDVAGHVAIKEAHSHVEEGIDLCRLPDTSIWALTVDENGSVVALTGQTSARFMKVDPWPVETIEDAAISSSVVRGLRADPSALDSFFRSPENEVLLGRGHLRRPKSRRRDTGGWEPLRLRRDQPTEWPCTAEWRGIVNGRSVLARGSYQGAVWLWDLNTLKVFAGPFADLPQELTVPNERIKTVRLPKVRSVAMGNLDGRLALVIAYGGQVRLWDVETATALQVPNTEAAAIGAVALGTLRKRDVIITGSEDGSLTVWDAKNSERLAAVTLDSRIKGVWVARGSELIGALTSDECLHLFDFIRDKDV